MPPMRPLDLAFSHIDRGDFVRAAEVLDAAARAGEPEAAHQLARLHLYRLLDEADAALARGWLDSAANAGHGPARYTRALVEAGNADGRWADDLKSAARGGHPLAQRSLRQLLAAQAERDGGHVPDDPDALDIAHASRTLPALRDDEDWRLQRGAFTAGEAAALRALATPLLEPSQAWDAMSGSQVRVPIRTSHDAPIDPLLEDVALRLLQRRLCSLAGLPPVNAEPMVVLRYRPGQEYRLHRDLLPPSTLADPLQGRGGQRAATVIAYLAAVEEGGETEFPKRELRVPPEPGAALVFRNLRPDGAPDADSLHAGLPVRRGEKWIATLWIRRGALRGF